MKNYTRHPAVRTLFFSAAFLAIAVFSVACTGSDSPLNSTSSAETGTVTVNLHDQAAPGIAEAMMTIGSVQLTAADGTVHDLNSPQLGSPFDLAQLIGGNQVNLGTEPVPAGDYVSLRLTVTDLTVVLTDTTTVTILEPADGFTVQIPLSLTVAADQDVILGVDFPLTAIGFDGVNWTVDGTQVALD
jgi:hypothetical protein